MSGLIPYLATAVTFLIVGAWLTALYIHLRGNRLVNRLQRRLARYETAEMRAKDPDWRQ